jgi:hypothetical protein
MSSLQIFDADAKRHKPERQVPVPTLAELHKGWTWVWCERCLHRAPMAFVPLMIGWGPNTSSDKLRRSARCTACGHKGAALQHPSWVDSGVGFQPFPVEKKGAAN